MGFFDAISGILSGGVGGKIADIIDKRVPDRDLAEKLKHETDMALQEGEQALKVKAAELDQAVVEGQNRINELEAQSSNLFNSGWRPSAGYVCVLGLAYQFVLQPLISWQSGIHSWSPPPPLDMGSLMTLLSGMLGLGTLRTTERIKGVIPPGK